jgi:hypothetical protein
MPSSHTTKYYNSLSTELEALLVQFVQRKVLLYEAACGDRGTRTED